MRVSHIFTYPFDGAQPVEQMGGIVEADGLLYDRTLVAYDPTTQVGTLEGKPVYSRIDQRYLRQLARVTPALGLRDIQLRYGPDRVDVPYDIERPSTMYVAEAGYPAPMFDAGSAAAALLQTITGHSSLRLGQRTKDWKTKVPIPDVKHPASLRIISGVSLRETENVLGKPIDVRRYRPNIVVDGSDLEPFAEDEWIGRKLIIGGNELNVMVDRLADQSHVLQDGEPVKGASATFGVCATPADIGLNQRVFGRSDWARLA